MGRQRGPAFYDRHYAREPRRARNVTHERHTEIARYVTGDSVLDLGCGVALIANMIGERAYLGIDFSSEAIASSRRVSENSRAAFICDSLANTSNYVKRPYDTVLMIEVLEHLAEPEAAVELAMSLAAQRFVATLPVDMRAPAHVQPTWTAADVERLIEAPSLLYQFGGPENDYWWLVVKEIE